MGGVGRCGMETARQALSILPHIFLGFPPPSHCRALHALIPILSLHVRLSSMGPAYPWQEWSGRMLTLDECGHIHPCIVQQPPAEGGVEMIVLAGPLVK